MAKPLPPRKLGKPADVLVKQGETIVLHDGKRIVFRATADKDGRYFTAWLDIVGTKAAVEAKIAELNLN